MSWIQLGQDINGEAANDQSGFSVSLSADGSRVAIGAIYNDGSGNNAGHVRVYDLSGNTWTKVGQDIDGEAANDWSGYSVSLSADGSRVAIGARYNDGSGNSLPDSGHVRVYQLSGNNWVQLGGDIDGEAAIDRSGTSVSLSANGSRVAIGANYNDNFKGHTRIYELSGNNWVQLGGDIDGEAANDESGYSVSLSADGSRVAIGAYKNDGSGNLLADSGHVRVYQLSNNAWVQLGQDINGEAAYDYSGYSVSLSADGSRVAIGAIYNDGSGNSLTNSGHVRVYQLSGNNWVQIGEDIDGEAANDRSGWSVSLSADGSRVAIGTLGNNTFTGRLRVYELSGNNWVQLGSDVDGEDSYNWSGFSVSLSADGSRVAIGAPFNDGSGNLLRDSGHVRVYEFKLPSPSLSNFPNISKTFFDPSFLLNPPTSNSNGVFTYTSSNTSVATISCRTVIMVGSGTTNIVATQSATSLYSSAIITATLTVSKTDVKILKEQGYTASQFKGSSYTINDLKVGGYTASQLKQAGYTLKELLIGTNYTINELKLAGYIFNHSFVTASSPRELE